jgi:hypothetical protein
MRWTRLFVGCVLGLLVSALPAAAQDPREMFVRGLGGVTFGTETAAVVGGGVGVGVARNFQVYFELGYITSILPKDAQDELEAFFAEFEEAFGVSVTDVKVAAPTFYGLFGGRFQRAGEGMQPFAEALFGFARTTGKFSALFDGVRITQDDAPDDFDTGFSSTDPALGFGAGLAIPCGRNAAIEFGYRLMIVLLEESQKVSKVYGAFRLRF